MKLITQTLISTVFLAAASFSLASSASWYVYQSSVDGLRICSQTNPGSGWFRASSTAYSTGGACNYYGR